MLKIGLAILALIFSVSISNAQLTATGVGGGFGTAGASYQGAGDVVSGAYAWYGLRGYTAAYSTGSNPVMDLVDQAGANQITINILSTGRVDVASINSWVTANSVTTIRVKKLYDQTGNARHVSQATTSQMPVLNLTGFGSLPAMEFVTASSQYLESSATVTQNQPVTISSVQFRNGTSGLTGGNDSDTLFMRTQSDGMNLYAGSSAPANSIALNGSWHAAVGVINGASSAVYTDGGTVTGMSPGSNNISAKTISIAKQSSIPVGYPTGSIVEVGFWPSAFNSTQAADMISNQRSSSNGYNF